MQRKRIKFLSVIGLTVGLAAGASCATAAEMSAGVEESARKTMNYYLKTCGVWHQYEKGKIDWKLNPTFNTYKEYVWQLGRFYFFENLSAYYAATKDPEAAKTFVDMISTWIDQAKYDDEPRKSGFDGTCWRSLDAGLRVKAWAMAWEDFKTAPEITPEFKKRFYASLRQHGEHLVNFCTTRNWLLSEMTGLIYLTVVFPELEKSAEWRAFAFQKLEEALDNQLYPDGFHYELSSGYHGALPGNYARILDLLKKYNQPMPNFVNNGLEKAFELYLNLVRPDGLNPALNDAGHDNNRLRLKKALEYYPNREDFRYVATAGKKGVEPSFKSVAMEYSGAFVLRTGWGAKDIWAYMDCGPLGVGHRHDDKLNFLLCAYGKEMIRDGGNYAYDSSEIRKYVLDSRAHNLAMIDHKSQNRREGYQWKQEELHKKADFTYSINGDIEWAKAKYVGRYGYRGEGYLEAAQRRAMYFVKKGFGASSSLASARSASGDGSSGSGELKPFFIISDILGCKDGEEHDYEILYHLEVTENYSQDDRSFSADFGEGARLCGFCSADVFKDQIGVTEPKLQGWKPGRYGNGENTNIPIHTPSIWGKFKGAKRVVTVLYPMGEGMECPLAGVEAGEGIADRDIKLVFKDGTKLELDENQLAQP